MVIDGLSNTFAFGETTKFHVNGAAFAWAYRGWVMVGVDPYGQNAGATSGGINVLASTLDPSYLAKPTVCACRWPSTFLVVRGRQPASWWCPLCYGRWLGDFHQPIG